MLNHAFLIRKMTEQDLDELMIIENESFSLPWSRQAYEAELQNQYANYLVCDWQGEVAAYVGMWTVFEDAHITNVAVGRRFRRHGYGPDFDVGGGKAGPSQASQSDSIRG